MILNDRFSLGIANWFYKNVELIFGFFVLFHKCKTFIKNPLDELSFQLNDYICAADALSSCDFA